MVIGFSNVARKKSVKMIAMLVLEHDQVGGKVPPTWGWGVVAFPSNLKF